MKANPSDTPPAFELIEASAISARPDDRAEERARDRQQERVPDRLLECRVREHLPDPFQAVLLDAADAPEQERADRDELEHRAEDEERQEREQQPDPVDRSARDRHWLTSR
jgi:hypothetical protein